MKAKKSLGQNFFVNENLGNQIISFINAENPQTIIEIGPGRGFFTEKLAKIARNLIVIEKDDFLAQQLTEMHSKIEVVNKDFLDIDLEKHQEFSNAVFFGSLPYNVSKPIIHKILSSGCFKKNCYFIIQKEVAEKYLETSGKSNILSLRTQLYAHSQKVLDIKPSSFIPQPKVMSTLIKFTPITEHYDIDETQFTKLLETAFRSPRKILKNNLKMYINDNISEILLNKRPEDLSLIDYLNIFSHIR